MLTEPKQRMRTIGHANVLVSQQSIAPEMCAATHFAAAADFWMPST
jgi:hypothetical protein